MEFKQLEAYVRAVELRSFSKAAEALYCSQPSVSLYVGALERSLGVRLLVRSSREVFPTEDGAVFYEYAKNLLAIREQAMLSMRARADGLCGEVSIAASSVPAQHILPEAIARFAAEHPNLSFSVTQSDTDEAVRCVATQSCELGLVGGRADEPRCVFEPLFSEPLVLIAPPGYETGEDGADGVARLFSEERFVVREPGSGTRACYETALRGLGIAPLQLQIAAVFSNTQGILRAVAEGLGLSIVSGTAARGAIERGEVKQVPLAVPLSTRSFYLVYHKTVTLSARTRIFAAFLKEQYKG